MIEQVPASDPGGIEPEERLPTSGGRSSTGVPSVDRVLDELDRLDELPLEEHLGAFERAHGSLRAALDAPADAPADLSADVPADPPA